MKRWSKYGNRKTYVGSVLFDSKREADRYVELMLMQKAGTIKDLQTQVPFELIPSIRGDDGKVIQRAVDYVADFTYWQDGKFVVEDAKGYRPDVYKIKKKLMLWRHGIVIKES